MNLATRILLEEARLRDEWDRKCEKNKPTIRQHQARINEKGTNLNQKIRYPSMHRDDE